MNLAIVFDHGDPVLIATFILLVSMSVLSWYLIAWKTISLYLEKKRLKRFQSVPSTHAEEDKVGSVALLLQVAATPGDQLEPEQRKLDLSHALDRIRIGLEKGLSILASIGSSAPFVGLFGTVWGIYIALTDLAVKGNASIEAVAGPMGEALVATALGLFAAIPSVLAYNMFIRSNKVHLTHLRHIAESLALLKQKGRD